MRTFTFIELENRDTGRCRTFQVRGDVPTGPRSERLDRFMKAHNLAIVAMYQVERETLSAARRWLNYVMGE